MNTPPSGQNKAVPPEAVGDSAGTAEVSPAASPQPGPSPGQAYAEALARFAAITDQWQQARAALLGEIAGAPSTTSSPKTTSGKPTRLPDSRPPAGRISIDS